MHYFPVCYCSDCNEYANSEAYQEAFAQLNQGDVLEAVDQALIKHGKDMMKAVWEEDAEAFWQPIWAQIEKQITDYELAAREKQEQDSYEYAEDTL